MTPGRIKSASILFGLILAALALIGWSQSWFAVTLAGSLSGHDPLHVGGDVGAPAVAALALASAAGFAAIAISGAFFRSLLAVLEVILGGCIILSAVVALTDPVQVVAGSVSEVSGLAGFDAISGLIEGTTATLWPFVTLVAGALLSLLGIVIVITGRMWPGTGRRYEPVRIERIERAEASENDSSDTAVSRWDELSGGSDPTSR